MFKGTYAGNDAEIEFVKLFNSSRVKFQDYMSNFSNYDINNVYMVRVTTKQISKLNNKKVFTRSDCYLAYFHSNITNTLLENNYLLDENILSFNKLKYTFIPCSGISIKMKSSNRYQILKLGPNSFNNLFGSYELGAGASLFCKNDYEMPKNLELIKGWKSEVQKMQSYFTNIISSSKCFYLDKNICHSIKDFSNNRIKQIIDSDTLLQKKIFNGINIYDEPYTAYFLYHGNDIIPLNYIDFSITTGSGRSKGNYTIVLKPK